MKFDNPLHEALANKDTQKALDFIAANAGNRELLNAANIIGETPLMMAMKLLDSEVVRALLADECVNATSLNLQHQTCIEIFIEEAGKLAVVTTQALMIVAALVRRKDIDFNTEFQSGESPLTYAAKRFPHTVKLLIDIPGLLLNAHDKLYNSALSSLAAMPHHDDKVICDYAMTFLTDARVIPDTRAPMTFSDCFLLAMATQNHAAIEKLSTANLFDIPANDMMTMLLTLLGTREYIVPWCKTIRLEEKLLLLKLLFDNQCNLGSYFHTRFNPQAKLKLKIISDELLQRVPAKESLALDNTAETTALFAALNKRRTEQCLTLLMDSRVNVNAHDSKKISILGYVFMYSADSTVLEALFKHTELDVNKKLFSGIARESHTPMQLATHKRESLMMLLLMTHPKIAPEEYKTPFLDTLARILKSALPDERHYRLLCLVLNETQLAYPTFYHQHHIIFFEVALASNDNAVLTRLADMNFSNVTKDSLYETVRELTSPTHFKFAWSFAYPIEIRIELVKLCLEKGTGLRQRFEYKEGANPCKDEVGTLAKLHDLLAELQDEKQKKYYFGYALPVQKPDPKQDPLKKVDVRSFPSLSI